MVLLFAPHFKMSDVTLTCCRYFVFGDHSFHRDD